MAYKITDFDGGSLPVTTLNPYGAIDDDITVVNSKSNNDIQVTMQKIMARVSIAPNSLPDNSVNGFQLYNAFVALIQLFADFGSWLNISIFGTNWSAGAIQPRVSINPAGWVTCQGQIQITATTGYGSPIATLPTGYWPSQLLTFVVGAYDSTVTNDYTKFIATVDTSGNINLPHQTPSITGTAANYIDISCIAFSIH